MKISKIAIFFLVVYSMLQCSLSSAAVVTGGVVITGIRTGWNSEQVGITINSAIPNPSNCPNLDGIVINTQTPGFKTHYATVLTAYSLGKTVNFVIGDGCSSGRPVFWGVYL